MTIKFADRMNGIKSSIIRELLKLTEDASIISFAGGLPAPELFPTEELQAVCVKVLQEEGGSALQYSATEGYKPLRKKIAERMTRQGMKVAADDVLITSGSQQGLEFSGRIFLNEGDIVICESPSYLGALNAFNVYRPKFVEITMDDDGMIIDDLEKALEENHEKTKFIYVIPEFQNPTGRTMSLERRKRLIELAYKYDIPIVEDNPYGELRFEGEVIPSIKSLDTKGLVIHLGTFSKIFCPGYRLGWVVANPEILSKYITVKQGADLQSSTISQREVNRYMEMYSLDEHVEKIKALYRKRKNLMVQTMKEEFPKTVTFTNPQGGLFTWLDLPEGVDAAEVFKLAIAQKVAFVPGEPFYPNGGHANHARLNFSSMPEDKIVEGIKRLGKVLKNL